MYTKQLLYINVVIIVIIIIIIIIIIIVVIIIIIILAHKPAEMVDLELYQIPGVPVNAIDSEITLRPRLLIDDKLLYTDMSSYLAELLVQSVTDKTQVRGGAITLHVYMYMYMYCSF